MTTTFNPGDWAEHKSGVLDPREVTEVSEDGSQIKIFIFTHETDWLPAANYDRLEAAYGVSGSEVSA